MQVGGLPVQHRLVQASPRTGSGHRRPVSRRWRTVSLPIGAWRRSRRAGASGIAVEWDTHRLRHPASEVLAARGFDGTTPDARTTPSPLTGRVQTRQDQRGSQAGPKGQRVSGLQQRQRPRGSSQQQERDPDRVAQPRRHRRPGGHRPGGDRHPDEPGSGLDAAWRSQVESPIITASTGGAPELRAGGQQPVGGGLRPARSVTADDWHPIGLGDPVVGEYPPVTSFMTRVTTAGCRRCAPTPRPVAGRRPQAGDRRLLVGLDGGAHQLPPLVTGARDQQRHRRHGVRDRGSRPGTVPGNQSPATAAASRRAAL